MFGRHGFVSRKVMRNALINTVGVLAFDPNSEDILYLELNEHNVMCNIRARKVRLLGHSG